MKKKKSTIAMIFAIIVFAISSTAFAFQNEPNGFRDFKFGMTLEQVRKIAGKDSLIPIPHDGPVIVPMDREQNAYYLKLKPPMISNVKTDENQQEHEQIIDAQAQLDQVSAEIVNGRTGALPEINEHAKKACQYDPAVQPLIFP